MRRRKGVYSECISVARIWTSQLLPVRRIDSVRIVILIVVWFTASFLPAPAIASIRRRPFSVHLGLLHWYNYRRRLIEKVLTSRVTIHNVLY